MTSTLCVGPVLGIPYLETGTQQPGILGACAMAAAHHSFLRESVAGYHGTGKEIPALQAVFLQRLVSSCHPQGEARDGTVVLGEQPSPLSQPGFLTQLLQSWWYRVLGFLPPWCGCVQWHVCPMRQPQLMPIG